METSWYGILEENIYGNRSGQEMSSETDEFVPSWQIKGSSLVPCRRFFLQNLVVAQLVNKFSAFIELRRFTTIFASAVL
jgi:hypothetical protein